MYCPQCHKVVVPGAKFCMYCGAALLGKPNVCSLQRVTIGRSSACDIVLTDRSVSRKHCTVEKLSDGTFFLRDLQSKNGTCVDGIHVTQKHISATSHIILGKVTLSGADILSTFSDNSHTKGKKSNNTTILFLLSGIATTILLFVLILPIQESHRPQIPSPVSSPMPDPPSQNWMHTVEKATVIVLVRLRNGNYSFGSGFFVNERTIITNRHVVENAYLITIGNKLIGKQPAQVIAISQGHQQDFAALSVEKGISSSLPLTTTIMRNEKIYAWGYPGVIVNRINWNGLPEVVSTSGEVNVIRKGASNIIVHSAKISPGNSGGPLVNEKGSVVGINTLLLGDKAGQYYISYMSEDIIKFLNDYGIRYNKM